VTATTVFLVRHAEHDALPRMLCGRMPGVTLGSLGRAQAARLAKRLAPEGLAAVYASPLERARETAEPIGGAAGVAVRTEPALNEIDYGEWSGRTWDDLGQDPAWGAWNADRAQGRPPGGETLGELQARVAGWLGAVRDRHAGERLAAVAHAEPIRAALAWVLGAPLAAFDRLEIGPASISVVVAGDWGFRVHAVNEVVR
jgi:broad specificity phosphatase PhoE